jgi:putative membrane protein
MPVSKKKPIAHHEKLDVDIRFLLANERTLLAWVRTGLALEAGGVALIHFNSGINLVGISIILLGAATTGIGYARFRGADTAIRTSQLPKVGLGPGLEVAAVIMIALILLVLYL